MKTAEEILVKYLGNDYSPKHRKDVIKAMEEYALLWQMEYGSALLLARKEIIEYRIFIHSCTFAEHKELREDAMRLMNKYKAK